MDRLQRLIRESLSSHLHEQQSENKKKDDVVVPEGCFGGPKHQLAALVSIIELLMRDKDGDGQRCVEDVKQFLKGKGKVDKKEMVLLLRKHNKPELMKYIGCL
jgi:hypothetical protein